MKVTYTNVTFSHSSSLDKNDPIDTLHVFAMFCELLTDPTNLGKVCVKKGECGWCQELCKDYREGMCVIKVYVDMSLLLL